MWIRINKNLQSVCVSFYVITVSTPEIGPPAYVILFADAPVPNSRLAVSNYHDNPILIIAFKPSTVCSRVWVVDNRLAQLLAVDLYFHGWW